MSGQGHDRENIGQLEEMLQNEFLGPRIGRLAAPGPAGEIRVEQDGHLKAARLVRSRPRRRSSSSAAPEASPSGRMERSSSKERTCSPTPRVQTESKGEA
jgi:hypothetical protein